MELSREQLLRMYPKLENPPVAVKHTELKRTGSSAYRSECPFCPEGVLLVRRDQKTMLLLREDNCIGCGQHVVYTDDSIAEESFSS